MCVRPEAGFCCVQYSLCGDQTAALAMSLSAGPVRNMHDLTYLFI